MVDGLEQDFRPCRVGGAGLGPSQTYEPGSPLGRLRLELLEIAAAGKGHDAEVLPLPAQHRQRAPADRAGGAEHRDALHCPTPSSR